MEYIYLDNAATTRQKPAVTRVMGDFAEQLFYNANALYTPAVHVQNQIDMAKRVIMDKLGVLFGDLVFTSGATESNNMVIFGAPRGKLNIINADHASITEPLKHITPDRNVNHTHTHLDATQIFCKIPFDVRGIDTISISAHKIGGPKGIGALWIRKGVTLKPIMYGGGHDIRAGTPASPLIVGFAKAVGLWDTEKNLAIVRCLRERLVAGLPKSCTVNTELTPANNPYIVYIDTPVFGQTIMNAMCERGIIIGIGSACSSKQNTKKKVIRVSFCPENTGAEIDKFLQNLANVLDKL